MNDSVFPQVGGEYGRGQHPGMDLRALFAGMAMEGWRASGVASATERQPYGARFYWSAERVAKAAVEDADALMKELGLT